jgi:hypothetical protein
VLGAECHWVLVLGLGLLWFCLLPSMIGAGAGAADGCELLVRRCAGALVMSCEQCPVRLKPSALSVYIYILYWIHHRPQPLGTWHRAKHRLLFFCNSPTTDNGGPRPRPPAFFVWPAPCLPAAGVGTRPGAPAPPSAQALRRLTCSRHSCSRHTPVGRATAGGSTGTARVLGCWVRRRRGSRRARLGARG